MSVDVLTAEAKEEWYRRYPLEKGGRVEIVNVGGPIDVTVGESGFVNLHVTRTAKALTDEGAKEFLSNAQIQETAAPAHIRVVTQRAQGPQRRRGPHEMEVRYAARVPIDAQVEISTNNGPLTATGLNGNLTASIVNGRIELTGIGGAVDATAVNGSVSAKLSQVTARVRLEATNGRISLEMPAIARANLSARAVNGGINVSGLPVESPTGGRRIRILQAPLNGGGPEIDLRVTNGRISIAGQ